MRLLILHLAVFGTFQLGSADNTEAKEFIRRLKYAVNHADSATVALLVSKDVEHPDLIISLFKLYHPMSIEMTKFDKKLLEMHVEVNFVRAPGHYVVVKFILQLNPKTFYWQVRHMRMRDTPSGLARFFRSQQMPTFMGY
ncbi:Dolichyl-diphosphooligosaccharide--protein glycosyltransferase subunit 2 [Caenorhabditis elegans]|uniref:Dolichyl-diphosphooligosaccharide--protein glycosyltransferase subunit 2 n=1 Tax=Caenorhabditis elegans TaxID=6239 RepID=P91049_CAEEL|nr:Dolichyl-diphosphooligosaccharide--protein glycosyltransferase subunit 2 [Caenorhabditis elegans]CCD64697.2 Dolichyl-diphosphooligosaccharide--protein glycosyltransferase subunit 2 [Caenorhabditis elegans]|eukprot:NP_494551.2 Uncharacterized protein CELE_C16C8.7 [Caenorhabditis elegans]